MKSLRERLIWARQQKSARDGVEVTQNDLALLAGVTQGNIAHLESGRTQTSRNIASIAQALGVDTTWLAKGVGEPYSQDHVTEAMQRGILQSVDAYNHNDNPNVVQIPKVTLRVAAGITGFSVDGSDDVDIATYPLERAWVERNNFNVSRLLAMRVKGDSMFPLYREGDIIVVNTADTKMVDTKEYVFNFDGDVVLKRLTRDGGSWWLTSENQEQKYHRRSVRSGETFIIGRVVKHDRIDL